MKPYLCYLLILCYALAACGRTEPLVPPEHTQRYQEGICPMALNLDFQGVWTNPNPHSKVPPGAAACAENIVNPRPGVAECVPGQEALSAAYHGTDERFSTGISYQGSFIEHTSDGGAEDSYLYARDPTTGVLTPQADVGDPAHAVYPPGGVARLPLVIAGEKLYMATSEGVRVKDGVGSALRDVAIPRGLSLAPIPHAGTLLTVGQSVAYRFLVSEPDADGVYQRGPPSGRFIYVAGATESVDLSAYLPDGVTTAARVELYRTGIADSGSSPGDTMFMVYQAPLDFGQPDAYFNTGINFITDTTPDELRGEPLYTNASQGGIVRENDGPPYARVVTAFDDSLLVANVTGANQLSVRMVGVPDAGDVITVSGGSYTAIASGSPGTSQFVIASAGTVSENIENTARNLVNAINDRASNTTVYAYYASSESDPPGIIEIEARTVSAGVFTIQASAHGDRYEPPIDIAQSSLATTEDNGLWVSKRGQHYAFPPLRSSSATYRFRVGVKGGAILAMAPLRESVIVFVEKEGVWKVRRTGAETWRADQINNNAHLLVPGSVAVVDNQVLALTTRGLVAVDEGGVEEIDLPIKDKTRAISALPPELLASLTFAVGDEARLRYTLYHPLTATSTTADHAWVYNADQGTWTERTDAASGGLVGEDDGRLYLGSATSNTLTRERLGEPVDVFKRPDGTAIPFRLEWTVFDEEDPGAEKQFTEMRLLTKDAFTGDVTFNCTNDLGGTESTTGTASESGEPFVLSWVPDGCQRTTRLKVDIQRAVLGQAFEVVGMKTVTADMYRAGMQR